MSTASDPDTLVVRFRNAVADEHLLTHEEIAEQIGVSLRTVSYWINSDVTPQKRYRRQIVDWLDTREQAA